MSRWFRLYTEVLDDPKVQRLPPELFKHWVNLLCLAGKDERGRLPDCLDAIAFALRLPDKDAANEVLVALQERGLFEDDAEEYVVPHNWNGRQFKSDNSTERVKRFRKRPPKQDETVSVTPPDTEQNRTEKKDIGADAPASDWPSDFRESFWKTYPLRVGKAKAMRKLEAIRKSGRVEWALFLSAVRQYAASVSNIERRFIKHPATWLEAGCWEDELPSAPVIFADPPNLIEIMRESPEWPRWAELYRQHKGKDPPVNQRGGWHFPREWAA